MSFRVRLKNYSNQQKRIKLIEEKIDRLSLRIDSIQQQHSNLGTRIQSGRNEDPVGTIASKLADYAKMRDYEILRSLVEREMIEDTIEALTYKERNVIYLHWFNGKFFHEVGQELKCKKQTIKNIHSEILRSLDEATSIAGQKKTEKSDSTARERLQNYFYLLKHIELIKEHLEWMNSNVSIKSDIKKRAKTRLSKAEADLKVTESMIENLSTFEKDLIYDHYIERLSCLEISEKLKYHEQTVKSHFGKILKKLETQK